MFKKVASLFLILFCVLTHSMEPGIRAFNELDTSTLSWSENKLKSDQRREKLEKLSREEFKASCQKTQKFIEEKQPSLISPNDSRIQKIASNPGKAYAKQVELRKKYQEACNKQISAEEQVIKLEKDLQNQAIDTENKANSLAKTFEEMKKEYAELEGKVSRLEHDKTILTSANDGLAKEVKRLQPYSLKTKALITAGIATTVWTAKEMYDAYQKLSVDEKWNSATALKKAKLLATHTTRNMASRPRQAFNFVKSKIQR